MASRKQALILALASARSAKAEKADARKRMAEQPKRIEKASIETEVITHPKRELAKACTDQAMLVGWERAIQKTAYENEVSEAEMRQILDDALDYEDKADPSGRIDGLEDWRREKRGSSELASPRRR